MTKIITIVMQLTGYRFPKYGLFGRDTQSRRMAEKLLKTKLASLNWAAGL